MYKFDVKKATEAVVGWIRDWFNENGKNCKAVIGISGGKDSSVAAALLVRALGADRVFGVLMPCGEQSDIDFSLGICKELNIEYTVVNIKAAVDGLSGAIPLAMSNAARVNMPARIRMTTLYAVAQSINGRVANTCNKSEDYVGYSTRYGDSVGDFSPISSFTVTEVKQIGLYLGISEKYIDKPPIDGLSGKTDEDNLGFTYAELDLYIREGIAPKKEIKEKIDYLNKLNAFKLRYMDCFHFEPNDN